jgi:hypothetical protein
MFWYEFYARRTLSDLFFVGIQLSLVFTGITAAYIEMTDTFVSVICLEIIFNFIHHRVETDIQVG